MEPLFFKAENTPFRVNCAKALALLQWSRFFSKRKIACKCRPKRVAQLASMEPLFFKAENPARACVETVSRCGFNGAAFFQSGKYDAHARVDFGQFCKASMEPLFFKAENERARPELSGRTFSLQWSRFFSKRKM